jgi:hypothetical protein
MGLRPRRWNALSADGWTPLVNWATFEVCGSNRPADAQHPGGVTGACRTGAGAALNDINGTERDRAGNYLDGPAYCHSIVVGGLEVPAAKRPATRSPVDPTLNLANGPGQGPGRSAVVTSNCPVQMSAPFL